LQFQNVYHETIYIFGLSYTPELVIHQSYCHIIIPQFSVEVLALFIQKFYKVWKVEGVRSVECNSQVIGLPELLLVAIIGVMPPYLHLSDTFEVLLLAVNVSPPPFF
jgi:hypothetical protein